MEEQEKQEVTEQSAEEVKEEQVNEEVKEDRPEINYKAELARKNAEIERLRLEMVSRNQQPSKRDPNDISTWSDHELRMLKKDPQFAQYHDQADDLLLERKASAILAKNKEAEKRVNADMTLRKEFPEALDPTSEFSTRMEHVIQEYDLAKTPAGRLAAAKMVALELKKGQSTAEARARKNETDRVTRVKSELVDGDRAKPTTESVNPDQKKKELQDKLGDTRRPDRQAEAVSDYLKSRGMTRDKFFK